MVAPWALNLGTRTAKVGNWPFFWVFSEEWGAHRGEFGGTSGEPLVPVHT